MRIAWWLYMNCQSATEDDAKGIIGGSFGQIYISQTEIDFWKIINRIYLVKYLNFVVSTGLLIILYIRDQHQWHLVIITRIKAHCSVLPIALSLHWPYVNALLSWHQYKAKMLPHVHLRRTLFDPISLHTRTDAKLVCRQDKWEVTRSNDSYQHYGAF